MKFPHLTKKKVAALGLTFGVALGAGGIAAAYFTTTGSGTGTANVGAPLPVTLSGTVTLSASTPGTPVHVTVTVTNPGGVVTIGKVGITSITYPPGCPSGSFTYVTATTSAKVTPGSTTLTTAESPTITLVTLPFTPQTACTGVAITIHLGS